MERRKIYTNREAFNERVINRLQEKEDISPKNRELLNWFKASLSSRNTKESRTAKLIGQILKISELLKKDFDKVSKKELEILIATINSSKEWGEVTKADYRRCVKQFYSWLLKEQDEEQRKTSEYSKIADYIKTGFSVSYQKQDSDSTQIITEDDLRQIIENGCFSLRDKAFMALLHESGFRIEEMLNIRICDIQLQGRGARITVNGKTGVRTILVIISVVHLLKYLDSHELKQDPNSFLWYSLTGTSTTKKGNPLMYSSARKIIKRCMRKAGITKKYNPHWFRHSRATINAEFMTEATLSQYMGWTIGSDMPRRYIHARSKQVDDSIMRMRGLEDQTQFKRQHIPCSACGFVNSADTNYCGRCGAPMSVKVAVTEQDYMTKALEGMAQIMADPKLMTEYQEFLKLKMTEQTSGRLPDLQAKNI